MKNKDDSLIRRILKYCDEVDEAVRIFGKTKETFSENRVYRNAACMPIMQIGELCKLVSDEMREEHDNVDWRGWCGVRDIIAHQYTNLDFSKTWTIIERDLPRLQAQLNEIIVDIDAEGIERIKIIARLQGLTGIDAEQIFHKIVDDTGVSLNAFTDEKIEEFIKDTNR